MHLLVEEPPDHHRRLTGAGMRYDVICAPCAGLDDPGAALRQVCEGCVERLEDYSEVLGWLGEPAIRRRDVPLEGTWTEAASPVRPVNDRCVAPLPEGWLVLTTEGLLAVAGTGDLRPIGPVDVVQEAPQTWNGRVRGPSLYTSPDGAYAAVVTDYGSHGSVLGMADGGLVLRLQRDTYHPETTPFPVAFLPGRSVVVAATAWNRLDAFELPSGRLLTARDNDVDYFHGALHPSPSGRLLLDDGWVWAPAGLPRVHDAAAWLDGDPHATEHTRSLTQRWYAWDQPVAWIDEDTVAVQRIGRDDEAMLDGVELYDVRARRRTGMFAGPAGPMWACGRQLYVVTPDGLEIWDPADGARTGRVEGFRPVAHDPGTGAFAELTGEALRTWTPRRPAG